MSQKNEATVELTESSRLAVEKGAAAFQAMGDLAEKRRLRIEELESENKLQTLEIDRLRIDVHDMKEKLHVAEGACAQAVGERTAYETLVALLGKQIGEFVPPTPPRPTPQALNRKTTGQTGRDAVAKGLEAH